MDHAHPPTLLVVDDEPDVLESLQHLLRRRYRVLTAHGGAEGLRLLEAEAGRVHVILSDQRMPGMGGDAFLARAREVAPDAVRLLFTGYADIQAVINAINEGGIFRYVLKPWDPAELEATIRQAAEQYELLADRRRLIADLQASNARLTEANRALAEADQLKTAFLEVASHELNTPIAIVQGYAELLRLSDPGRPEAERELVRRIGDGTRRLGDLVRNMLRLVVARDFEHPLRTRPVDLAALVRRAAGEVGPFVAARRLAFTLELADDLGTFELDEDKIRDVLLNLLSNAVRFTPDGGSVGLAARPAGPDEAEIVVADRGIGLEPRALRHLFSPFFTEFEAEHHSSGEHGFGKRGIGLGLYLVRTFVEEHGGRVSADSRPGAGTTITVRLPRKACPRPGDPLE